MLNHRTLTAAMIDSRDFLAARRRADNKVLLPAGPKIAFSGGLEYNDHHAIWDRLDRSMRGTPTRCCCTAALPKAPSASPPVGPHHSSATTGCSTHCRSASSSSRARIQENLADKAKRLGIPVWRFPKNGAT